MYPKDKKSAALLSETIREMLADKGLMDSLIKIAEEDPDFKKPKYWDALEERTGISAMVMAQMIKAACGDTQAFTALSKYGFGEKVQIETSDFYKADKLEIQVVKTPDMEEIDEGNEGATPEHGLGNGTKSATADEESGSQTKLESNAGDSTSSE